MATKKTTVHPITAFRKANEARLAPVKRSMQKAQEGMSFKNTYAGPLTESDTKRLNQTFPSTTAPNIPFASTKPNMGYGTEDMYRQKESGDRSAFENYLRSPAVGRNNKRLGKGFNNEALMNQEGNRQATIASINEMNNIDWKSEEGNQTKKILDRDYKEAYKKGGLIKKVLPKAQDGITTGKINPKKYLEESRKRVKTTVNPLRKKEIEKGIKTYDDYLKQQILKKNKKGGVVKTKKKG